MNFKPLAVSALLLGASTASHAMLIDFETTSTGGTPVDDSAVTGTFTNGLVAVEVGFDTDGDLTRDIDATFEAVGDTDSAEFGYFNGGPSGPKDEPNTVGAMGDYFLRSTGFPADTTQDFIIDYVNPDGTSALTAQIWDIDGRDASAGTPDPNAFESWMVSAYGQTGNLLDTLLSPVGNDGENGALNGEPWEFAFDSATLGENVYKVVIEYTGTADDVGLAFDNFNADADAVVPEPTTLALMGIGFAAMGMRRRKAS